MAILEAAAKRSVTKGDPAALALAECFLSDGQYAKALPIAERLLKEVPQSISALVTALRAAYAVGNQKEADAIFSANLERFKSNANALRAVAAVALEAGDTERAHAISHQIIDSGRAVPQDYNQLAWGDLMAGKVTTDTIEIANKGMMLGGRQSPALMHTLAAVDAELSKEGDARSTLLQRMQASGSEEPDDDDWYVFARIAEQYGLTHEAAGLYRKLAKPRNELMIPASCYNLAQRRLKVIGE